MQEQEPVNPGNMGQEEPHAPIPQGMGNPMEEACPEPVDLIGESMVESSNLDEIKVFLFPGNAGEEAYSCMSSFTLQVHHGYPPTPGSNGGEASYDPSSQSKKESNLSSSLPPPQNFPMNQANTFIIWNIRGGNNDDFRRNFHDMITTHHPCMVTLLETRMTSHGRRMHDIGFSDMIEVPAVEQSGGIAVL